MTEREYNFKKLQNFLKLKYNWNGNRAEPFSFELVMKCVNIINFLPCQPSIFPIPSDAIQFEFEHTIGYYLEFEIYEDKIEMFLDNSAYKIEGKVGLQRMYDEILYYWQLTSFLENGA